LSNTVDIEKFITWVSGIIGVRYYFYFVLKFHPQHFLDDSFWFLQVLPFCSFIYCWMYIFVQKITFMLLFKLFLNVSSSSILDNFSSNNISSHSLNSRSQCSEVVILVSSSSLSSSSSFSISELTGVSESVYPKIVFDTFPYIK